MTISASFGQTNRQTLIHKGSVFNVFQENVTLPNNVLMKLDVIRHPGAAAIDPEPYRDYA